MISDNYTVLVIDDDQNSRDMLAFDLRLAGFETKSTASGLHGLHLAEQRFFDIILLKIFMPDVSGVDIVQTLRRKFFMRDMPVIVLGRKEEHRCLAHALRFGANDFVTTPVDKDVILARIKTQLLLRSADKTSARSERVSPERLGSP